MISNELINYMTTIKEQLDTNDGMKGKRQRDLQSPTQEHLIKFRAYLRLFRCSYWLPPDRYHYITPDLLKLLISCVGDDVLDEDTHDCLSALLNLMASSSIVVIHNETLPDNWLDVPSRSPKSILNARILEDALFDRFEQLPPKYFTGNATKVFRTWFQWISHAVTHKAHIKALYLSFYWSTLRTGLVSGFSDQRKYCLGILRTSLLIPQHPISLPQMTFEPNQRLDYVTQYEKYANLFEVIVLDRYVNQVQACLSDLTVLLGSSSLISADWSTALFSAALNPKVQDGVRKLVGNWYLKHVISQQGSISAHTSFLIEGFLPWATQGSLFTNSLVSTRVDTSCIHGASVAETVAIFIVAMDTESLRRQLVSQILTFVLDSEGKIFSPSVLYLLEGLVHGLKTRPVSLGTAELQLVLRVSRLAAFPELGTDLCITYFADLCGYVNPHLLSSQDLPGYNALKAGYENLKHCRPARSQNAGYQTFSQRTDHDSTCLIAFNKRLEESRHRILQDGAFASACGEVIQILNKTERNSVLLEELLKTLEAIWEEADRQQFPRRVIVSIVPLLFHPTCLQACSQNYTSGEGFNQKDGLITLLSKALVHLQHSTQGRPYVLSILAMFLRRACFSTPSIISILPLGDTLFQLTSNPPAPKKEFLFEVAAAQKLQQYLPLRDYTSYYGEREWYGYAAIIDTINRISDSQMFVAQGLMDRLLEPWRMQEAPVPIVSKWKNVLQLQVMLLLTESCISDENAGVYLDAFTHALVLEHWPRYRYLLEWIIARIYYRFPSKTKRILVDLARLDENSPAYIASLIRLAILCAPFLHSEEFALKLMTQLIPLSASPKVQVRHEAHWSFPILFGLSVQRKWKSIIDNPAFQALDCHVRTLDRFSAPASTIRTLKLDVVADYTVTNILQGRYLSIETPELDRVAYEDFVKLYHYDSNFLTGSEIPAARVPLGEPNTDNDSVVLTASSEPQPTDSLEAASATPAFYQTKSGFDLASFLPISGPPSAQQKRPASVILIASLIDNPTNLGGLSRISESFGLEALYIDDLRKIAHKDFKATSVTSEKHLPILELKIIAVPDFITSMKRQGYEIVGIEQTDRSGMLGTGGHGGKDVGTLPKKCVLVLGSERGGISSEVLAVVDRCVEIRTVGVTRSLNVQTAGGIAVYEWWREWSGTS
jgi:tRNA guanosine-2'-O-methyltransferase